MNAASLLRVTDIAISSYSFHRLVKSGEIRLEDTTKLARECGADAIEIATGGTLGPALDEALAARLADAADAADVAIVGFALHANLVGEDNQLDEAALESTIAQIAAASSIGVDRVRHDAMWRAVGDDLSDEAWDACLWPLTKASCSWLARTPGHCLHGPCAFCVVSCFWPRRCRPCRRANVW